MTHTTEQLEQMLADATPGPWGKNVRRMFGPVSDADDQSFGMVLEIGECDYDSGRGDANATLIAAAPTITAELIAARRKLEAAEKLVEALRDAQQSIAAFMGEFGYPTDTGIGDILREVSAALTAWEAAQ